MREDQKSTVIIPTTYQLWRRIFKTSTLTKFENSSKSTKNKIWKLTECLWIECENSENRYGFQQIDSQ